MLRPFPQYGSITNSGHYIGISNYDALELKLQKRMSQRRHDSGSYTFSKLMTDAEYLTSWLDSTGTAGYQDYNNPMSNYSLSSFDARQRLVVSFLHAPDRQGPVAAAQPERRCRWPDRRMGIRRHYNLPGRLSAGPFGHSEYTFDLRVSRHPAPELRSRVLEKNQWFHGLPLGRSGFQEHIFQYRLLRGPRSVHLWQ